MKEFLPEVLLSGSIRPWGRVGAARMDVAFCEDDAWCDVSCSCARAVEETTMTGDRPAARNR